MNQKDEDEGKGFEFNDIIDEIAINEPPIGEVKSVVQRMKNGVDSTTAELLKEAISQRKNPSINDEHLEVRKHTN